MSWWDRFKRAAPIAVVPDTNTVRNFGPGVDYQPAKRVLLQENVGVANAATRAIASRLSSLLLETVADTKASDGSVRTEILPEHPLTQLLANPHPNFTYRALMRLTGQWIITVGEAYWQKVNNGFGVPTQLHPISPEMVSPSVKQGVIDGYWITDANGKQYLLPPNEMIRIWFPDPRNPWQSEGYIGPSAIALDAHKFMGQHIRAHYQYDATPKVVLESEKEAPFPDGDVRTRFALDWINSYARRTATGSQGAPRILPPGMSAKELSGAASPATKDFMEYLRDELLMSIGGVPRSVLGQVVHGDRSSAEVNQWVFDMYAVAPVAYLIEDALTHQLATEFADPVRVRFAQFISADKTFELLRELQDLEHGVRTINDVLTDREADEVPWGAKPTVKNTIQTFDPNAPPPKPAIVPAAGEMTPRTEQEAHSAVRRAFRKPAA